MYQSRNWTWEKRKKNLSFLQIKVQKFCTNLKLKRKIASILKLNFISSILSNSYILNFHTNPMTICDFINWLSILWCDLLANSFKKSNILSKRATFFQKEQHSFKKEQNVCQRRLCVQQQHLWFMNFLWTKLILCFFPSYVKIFSWFFHFGNLVDILWLASDYKCENPFIILSFFEIFQ